MILKDFEKGGFPIGRLSPIMAITSNGIKLAYDNYGLKEIVTSETITGLYGIWPGKHTTCLFVLDLSAYGKYAPPQDERDIDNSSDITIYRDKDNKFIKLTYRPYQKEGKEIISTSINKTTADYVIEAGRKYRVAIEEVSGNSLGELK